MAEEGGGLTDKERFERRVGLAIAIIAALMSVVNILDGHLAYRAKQAKAESLNRWGHYQAKSIKQYLFECEAGILRGIQESGLVRPGKSAQVARMIDGAQEQSRRYVDEKKELGAKAEASAALESSSGRKADRLDLSMLLFQISIVLGAVAVLTAVGHFLIACVGMAMLATVVALTAFWIR